MELCIEWVTSGQLHDVSCSCVCECFWEEKWVEKEICYFWFSIKNYRILSIKSMIKRKYKWIGKRWQWIARESFEFRCANWPLKKYVVFRHILFFAAVLSSSSFHCFSCCVLLAYTTYFSAHYTFAAISLHLYAGRH